MMETKRVKMAEPEIGEAERKYVLQALDEVELSGHGRHVKEFEQRFAEYCEVNFSVMVPNGTIAPHLAMAALGVGPGDEVVLPSQTISTVAFAVTSLGAKVAPCDVDRNTWTMDPSVLKMVLSENTKVVMPTPIFSGIMPDMEAIDEIIQEFETEHSQDMIYVIEDFAESIGSKYQGKRSGGFGDMGTCSLFANKNITTGEGGVITTDSAEWDRRLRYLRNCAYGIGENKFLAAEQGFNYRPCFPAGTKILVEKDVKWKNDLGEGVSKKLGLVNIEDIRVDDKVLTYDEETRKKVYCRVLNTSVKNEVEMVRIRFSNGNELVSTSNHPIAVNRNGDIVWVAAKDIGIGNECLQYHYHSLDWRINGLSNRERSFDELFGYSSSEHGDFVSEKWKDKCSEYNSSEYRDRLSEAIRNVWKDPESSYHTEEYRQLKSEVTKKNWDNKTEDEKRQHMLKMWKGTAKRPTSLEIKLDDIIEDVCPGKFVYNDVIDEACFVQFDDRKKIPDFISMNGVKKVIEAFGDYWHNEEEVEPLISDYKKAGWECLIIWENELDDVDKVKERIKNFVYNPNVEVVMVTDAQSYKLVESIPVYNLEVEDNNNYFAYGILVHNCNLSAALGLGQLDNIDYLMERRYEINRWYRAGLSDEFIWQEQLENCECVPWMNGVLVPQKEGKTRRSEFMYYMESRGIETRSLFPPIGSHPYLLEGDLVRNYADEIISQYLWENGVLLPSGGPSLTEEVVKEVCQVANEFLKE